MGKHRNISDYIHRDRNTGTGQKSFYDEEFEHFDGAYRPTQKGSKSGGSKFMPIKRCYESHPPLILPGTDLKIYGGSCASPIVLDADIYIGFDQSMRFTERNYPWKKGAEVLFKIPDMGVPAKPDEFKKLIKWTRKQLEEGRKIHCGCIGGHGRTGMFLAAMVCDFGEEDAITYVRKHYCQKAVESSVQVKFLGEHFGIKSVGGSKPSVKSSTGTHLTAAAKSKVYKPIRCTWKTMWTGVET